MTDFDVKQAFPTHPDFGRVHKYVPASDFDKLRAAAKRVAMAIASCRMTHSEENQVNTGVELDEADAALREALGMEPNA